MAISLKLQECIKLSADKWKDDLRELFLHAKDRFPDVVWEMNEDQDNETVTENVWGHKAIVYARAPASFQNRYFSFTPLNKSSVDVNDSDSFLSLENASLELDSTPPSVLSSLPSHDASISKCPAPLLRLKSAINSTLFVSQVEHLYTGEGLSDAFEFLFESGDTQDNDSRKENPQDLRMNKLQIDLIYMWRSRLYSDVRLTLQGADEMAAVFSCQKFILISRSPYFRAAISHNIPSLGITNSENDLQIVPLPAPPFTPAALHFCLGFIYAGTLDFSKRTFDLSTALAILQSAQYLDIPTLQEEVRTRIVEEMMHGFFYAFQHFDAYEAMTQGKWGVFGCKCSMCVRRAPRILEFSLQMDVQDRVLELGGRRALVGMFGEGWCTSDFANLPAKVIYSLAKGVGVRTKPMNVLPLLFAAEAGLAKLEKSEDFRFEMVKDILLSCRAKIGEVLVEHAEECFKQKEWQELVDDNGANSKNMEKMDWIVSALTRSLAGNSSVAKFYQTLILSILGHPDTNDTTGQLLLAPESTFRPRFEQLQLDIVKINRSRWMAIRSAEGFDELEDLILKELSDLIEVPVTDLLNPVQSRFPWRWDGKLRATDPQNQSSVRSKISANSTNRTTTAISCSSIRTTSTVPRSSRTTTTVPHSSIRTTKTVPGSSVRSTASALRPSTRTTTTVPRSSVRTTATVARTTASIRGGAQLKDDKNSPRPRSIRTKKSDSSQLPSDNTSNLGESNEGHTISDRYSGTLEMQERPGFGALIFLLRQIQDSTSLPLVDSEILGDNNDGS